MSEQTLFEQARKIADPAARSAFLDRACGTEPDIRRRLEERLAECDTFDDAVSLPTAKSKVEPALTADVTAEVSHIVLQKRDGVATDETRDLDLATAHLSTPTLGVHSELPSIPGYEVLDELGRGGMGIVYKAHQHGLKRLVALKMILTDGRVQEKALIRFLAEAEAVAAIRHPAVVEVYHFGEHNGRPFMALEYCAGGSLADRLKSGAMKPTVAARVLAIIAEGVGAAHTAGIVHRDLKPHNVLITEEGFPKVTDFGLAKRAAGDAHITKTNAVMGTPAYMAPEQAQGGTKFVGPPADVWALGIILYEMVSGKRPFAGNEPWQILAAVMKAEVIPLRRVMPSVPRDLQLICAKCLSREPQDRYADGFELAADLRRFIAGDPVSVRPLGPVARLSRWTRRNKMLAATTLAALLAMIVGTGASLWQANRAKQAANRADTEARQAEKDRDAARFEAFRAEDARNAIQLQYAYSNFEKQDYQTASLALGDPGKLPEAVRDRWENSLLWAALNRAFEPICLHYFADDDPNDLFQFANLFGKRDDRGPVWNWCLSRDGRRLAVDSPLPPFMFPKKLGLDGTIADKKQPADIRIWDLQTRQPVAEIQAKNKPVCELAFDPSAQRLAAACLQSVILWNAATGQRLREITAPQRGVFVSVCFSADGKRLFCGGYDGYVRVVDPDTGLIEKTWTIQEVRQGEPFRIRCLKLTTDGKYLVGGLGRTGKDQSAIGRVVIWNAASGERKSGLAFPDVSAQIVSMDISRDGKWLATMERTGEKAKGSAQHFVQLWDLSTGQSKARWEVPTEANHASVETNTTNGAWRMMMDPQMNGGGQAAELSQLARGDMLQVCFDPTGKVLATTGKDGIVRLWDRNGTLQGNFQPPGEYFWQIAWPADGKLLLGDSRGLVSRLDPSARLHSRTLEINDGQDMTVENMCVSADGTQLLLSAYQNPKSSRDAFANRRRQFRFQTLRLSGDQRVADPVDLPEPCINAYSDGVRTVVAGEWLNVEIRDASGRRQLYAPAGTGKAGHVNDTARFRFSADGMKLSGVIRDFIGVKAFVWDPATGKKLSEIEVPESLSTQEFASGVSPNGRLLAIYLHGPSPSLQLLDLESGKQTRKIESLAGLQGNVRPTSVAIADDGETLFLGDANGRVHIWNLETEQEKLIFQAHSGRVTAMLLSSDGRRLYTSGAGTVAVWESASQTEGMRKPQLP